MWCLSWCLVFAESTKVRGRRLGVEKTRLVSHIYYFFVSPSLCPHLYKVTSQFLFIPLDVRCRTNQYIVINRPTVIVPYDADLEFCRETLKYLPQNAEWSRAFIKAFMLLVRVERSQLEPDDKRHLQTLFSKLNVMNGAFTDRLVESLGTA
jgi:hypothetical protein